ncbi:hypothetical protein [Nonomuraea aridisoli]|uniref:hypothetical protein n=1 Tax=Nonomuraea aridisoli TaxID=2070368 RepID=UPI0011B93886|nr:hypothetical protein [Nonomuraea aridisoli]
MQDLEKGTAKRRRGAGRMLAVASAVATATIAGVVPAAASATATCKNPSYIYSQSKTTEIHVAGTSH